MTKEAYIAVFEKENHAPSKLRNPSDATIGDPITQMPRTHYLSVALSESKWRKEEQMNHEVEGFFLFMINYS